MKPRTHACADCPTLITKTATRCRACAEAHARRPENTCVDCPTRIHRESTRCRPCAARFTARRDRDARVARLHVNLSANMANPSYRAKLMANMMLAVERRVEKHLGWCPVEYRDEWRAWSNTNPARRLPLAARRQQFLAKVRADLAALSPFERQERALRNGVGLVANSRIYRS